MEQTTLSTIPKLLAQVLAIYDIDPGPVFQELGVDVNAGAEGRVSMDKMTRLWQRAVELTSNPQLGLVAASLFQPTYLKGLGLAWMASANLEQGLRRFIDNSKLVNTAMQIELVEQGQELVIRYRGQASGEAQLKAHPCAIELGVGFFLKMFRLAASKNIPATGVYFNFAVSDARAAYEDYFQCPVYGNSEFNGIAFSRALLNELLPTHDPELVELNELAVSKYLAAMDKGETTARVTKIITALLPTGCPGEEVIAGKLHMSKRTLQRKLRSEGQSYLGVLTSVRLMLAKQQLAMTDMPVTEIAYQLGYGSPSTFARAFKKQQQESPQEYRAANKV